MHFEIQRSDIRITRLVESAVPATLPVGHVAMRLERAALTSNNVSYALSGDLLDYWGFFPTETGWGRLPVMGFGVVTQSTHADIAVGGRYFGFFPLGDHHVVPVRPSAGGFVDVAPWREKHAMAYRNFDTAAPTADDDHLLIFRGLFITSYLLNDYLLERNYCDARQVIITSASSKTSIALAHCLHQTSTVRVIGLTSTTNAEFTRDLGEYDQVVTYDELSPIEQCATVVVDMAGNAGVVAGVHERLAGHVAYSCSVGATHWNAPRQGVRIPDPKPEFFFAPSQLSKRGKELGREMLNESIFGALSLFIGSTRNWLTIAHTVGAPAVSELYESLVHGNISPTLGNIVSFE